VERISDEKPAMSPMAFPCTGNQLRASVNSRVSSLPFGYIRRQDALAGSDVEHLLAGLWGEKI
jgi:hypothetical protein